MRSNLCCLGFRQTDLSGRQRRPVSAAELLVGGHLGITACRIARSFPLTSPRPKHNVRGWNHTMAIKALPLSASDDEIKALVVEWSELLAQKRFQEAIEMFFHCHDELLWTPTLLEDAIAGYGVPDLDPSTLTSLLADWGVERFEITSLLGRADQDEIIAISIQVDRGHFGGLDPEVYLGMVHYHDVPLSGYRSDLTARFHIKRVGADRLTLEFVDIHVM